ncbi:AAA family ATPase [Telmatospirillum siberiense]|uniref:Aminoglycoside phosphotransferase domain-containing protein n=1 Tax=Telmatospirillum siberiense TaxID=382514 RepID=A0A2N3Q0A5_9PROT|nr:bifunctional aminoglycoside phosphotransferase/ATP-binding protein [Telmatospirillum siberiense]PKU26084.1 hypothetical protein CWS72_02830 [Telmatospirillum siberiense]
MTADSQAELVAWLSLPSSYGQGVTSVDRIDTHISSIFLAGERAYKLKRAVRLPFLDFTTLEQRRTACERELVVNRRTAPELYLGLVAVTRDKGGALAFDGEGATVDWVIVMARFDQEHLFDRLAAKGGLARDDARALADVIASFHQSAEPQSEWGGEAGASFTINTNQASLARFAPGLFDPAQVGAVTDGSLAWLFRLSPLLERRRLNGLVRRCHGDLHLGNICLFKGRPTLFDAIEFNEEFACIDVFYDLSFLIMDLEARGLPDLASAVFNRYLERTGDFDALPALPLFLSLRAAIRAHVCAATAEAGGRAEKRGEAVAYLARAGAYLAPSPPRLLAVGGLSGSGKSRLAADLAPFVGAAPGAVALRSDVLRKHLAGIDPFTRLSAEGYSEEMTGRTYATLYEQAERILRAGHAVIADAVFSRPEQRAAIEAVASRAGVPFDGLWLDADPKVLRERVDARRNDASDATVAVLERQLTYPLGDIFWRRYDASGGKAETFLAVRKDLAI